MKTIILTFAVLFSAAFAGEPAPKKPTVEDLQKQVAELQQKLTEKDAQISVMQGNILASQKLFGACSQILADAERRAAGKP
jgi:Tfp pilus assembly protein FimV